MEDPTTGALRAPTTPSPAAHDAALDRIDDLRGGLLEVAALIAAADGGGGTVSDDRPLEDRLTALEERAERIEALILARSRREGAPEQRAADTSETTEVVPGFSIDRQVVLAINDSREEVIEAGRQLLGVLQRAHAASSAGYNTVKAHPDEDPDELWAKIPGLEALVDAVYAVRELAGLFSNVTPAWPATFDGSPVDC